jgi:hypothetical protein
MAYQLVFIGPYFAKATTKCDPSHFDILKWLWNAWERIITALPPVSGTGQSCMTELTGIRRNVRIRSRNQPIVRVTSAIPRRAKDNINLLNR